MPKNPYIKTSPRGQGSKSGQSSIFKPCLILVGILVICSFATTYHSILLGDVTNPTTRQTFPRDKSKPKESLRILFIGNSILFMNDSPGLLVRLIEASGKYTVTHYETCLKAGMYLNMFHYSQCPYQMSQSRQDMTMEHLFDNTTQSWDYVILNDQTKAPALRLEQQTTRVQMRTKFAQEFWDTGATPIFLQTAAYRHPFADFGTFEQFTKLLHDGYHDYANEVTEWFQKRWQSDTSIGTRRPKEARVSPVGEAYAEVKSKNVELWEKLYMADGIHPSPLGTWLQVCVLYATMLKEEPPKNYPALWITAQGRPPQEEATELWSVALQVTGIMDEQFYVDHS
ncbi:expressed unknown protein [Seminavis robusta]|uniref:SGNH/GDSL hydrolase family protein n=1 Tax=Seminavis robusta TaxID=568900 RepID=A0A9N8DU58_9STRA|nr:expressed unknown protein [Seminavis robusta]|eukprot:Sro374_g129160.1 n/a (341) ;mRNA; f:4595-5617